jgi:hypothetical protein
MKNSEELQRVEGATKRGIDENRAMWKRKIEQRWFVGAHSNIGGGHANNLLAQRPLAWVMEGAAGLGLESEPLPAPVPVTAAEILPRDSHAEFAPPLWETILRNKRNFRIIDPAPKLHAGRNGHGHGFALETINEVVDDSVIAFWENSERPIPPNLECWLARNNRELPSGSIPARHIWLREGWFSYTSLVVWTSVAVFGAYALDSLGGFTNDGLPLWFAFAAALFLPLLDWALLLAQFVVGGGTSHRD